MTHDDLLERIARRKAERLRAEERQRAAEDAFLDHVTADYEAGHRGFGELANQFARFRDTVGPGHLRRWDEVVPVRGKSLAHHLRALSPRRNTPTGGSQMVVHTSALGGHGTAADVLVPDPRYLRDSYLYRHWDAHGQLLYIGITVHLRHRESGHAKTSRWMAFHTLTTAERHPTEGAASQAEGQAIRAERPLFNIDQNDNASARLRVAAYLAVSTRRARYLSPPTEATGIDYQCAWWSSLRQRISDVIAGFDDYAEETAAVDMLVEGLHPSEVAKALLAKREPGQTPPGRLVNRRSGEPRAAWPHPFLTSIPRAS